ncbi:MAG: hypothetical protein FK734_07980 [Asgard group archaeon]|nr:hypothetical protein [Asgard group archaeon]
MKGVVVYDSYYGNTKLVAEAVIEQLKMEGYETEIRSIKDKYPASPYGDILFLGSPIRLGSVTRKMKKYLKKLDKNEWKDKPFIIFTTILMQPENATDAQIQSREKYDIAAGKKFCELVKAEGLKAVEEHLWVDVKDIKGPLVDSAIDKTKQFTQDILKKVI